ncbi:hypothetical protein Back11_05510 [Paenibacillus baekrokdamisoli]|uniref:Uncharacterized protein n=1 Tax=Paenibacillus baekrokdamisoli TaxID=1712516 RepID=A0A3G9ILI8_9BACL|nr:LysM peptidoglycan-binding domain-containing protein [Paenibacillus baekrokdamisoli]MBB3067607.1 stage VI sporulation protein D [Paenibacillus baekrokdamisoli]BBH19206.1 hypothetical protein Back11_05510 [Paenibacillus baekrokdamisoli]
MSNQTNGLRFDVYERVHLPDDVAAIEELEEIELVPRIQIVQQGEQVLLKGHLLLSGVYRAQNELDSEQALEHWIPVEITLPMNRVQRLDDVSVEIDNFDVDLLSARTLNITGVLSLLGIELDQPREQEQWPREEPFIVVHKREEEEQNQRESEEAQEEDEYSSNELEFTELSEQTDGGLSYPSFSDSFNREAAHRETQTHQALQWEQEAQLAEAQRQAARQEILQRESIARAAFLREEQLLAEARKDALQRESNLPAQEWSAQEQLEQEPQEQERSESEVFDIDSELAQREPDLVADAETNRSTEELLNEQDQDQESINRIEEPAPIQAAFSIDVEPATVETPALESELERKEMRVALGSKRIEEEKAPSTGGIGFRSLLQSSRREQEARAAAEQVAEKAAAEARKSTGDDIEWKNLFYGRSNDDHSFRKLKLCIVQREETLETIAGRYQLQPREIILYNRLSDQSVSEGQVLYIP